VRVVVMTDESGTKTLGFVFPEGPVLPRPERDIIEAGKKRANADGEPRRARKAKDPDAPAPEKTESARPRSVPETPLKG
jgi:ATP-dependent Clp protease ATP-binding subunit ClpA